MAAVAYGMLACATAALLATSPCRADPVTPEPPRLTGVVIAGALRYAIFAAPDGTLLADEGDRVGPFTVVVIRPGEVELRAPTGHYRLLPTPDGAVRQSLLLPPPITPLVDPYRRERETESDQ